MKNISTREERPTTAVFPFAVMLWLALSGCMGTPSEMDVARESAEAMGGSEAVLGATSLVLEGTGTTYRTGQNPSPEADLPEFEVHSYQREMDLDARRWRTEQVRTGHFLTGNPVIEQQLIQGSDRGIAFDIQANGNATRLAGQTGRERYADLYHHPLPIIRAVLQGTGEAAASNLRQEDGRHVMEVEIVDGPTLTLHIDQETNLPVQIESMAYHTNYGDVRIATSFSEFAETGGLRLPTRISQTLDRYPNGDFTVTNTVNPPLGDLSAPNEVTSAPEPGLPNIAITTEELAPGVWFLGPGYNSVLIEFPSFAALVEASQHDQRALAVIERARELLAGKPLRYVINSHFHIDHSGGIRAAVAEGLTVITHESHREYFEEMVERPHTIQPDHLERNPRALEIETVDGDGPYELAEGDRRILIHRLRDDAHSDGMLMVWLPEERILIEGDAFTPGARASPFAPNLLRQIRSLGLDVERIAPIHGQVVPLSELERTVQAVEAEGSPWGFPAGGGG